jgi:hypothetical protein
MREEHDCPNREMEQLFGVQLEALETSVDSFFGKDNLPRMEPMEKISHKTSRHALPGEFGVYGAKAIVKALGPSGLGKLPGLGSNAEVVGRFQDGKPALVVNRPGMGMAVACAALPGTAYVKPAIPNRPCDRGATDDAFTHFLPTRFDLGVRRFIAMWAYSSGAKRPILTSEDLVETSWIKSKKGIAVPLINYKGVPIPSLEVRVLDAGTIRHVSSAVHGDLRFSQKGEEVIIQVPLDVADMLLLRKYPPRSME